MATELSIPASLSPYEVNVQKLLQAQRIATEASLAGSLSTENSVPLTITPDSSAWSFTVSCQITDADLSCHGDASTKVVDLVLPYVGIDELVETVEATIAQARSIIDSVLV